MMFVSCILYLSLKYGLSIAQDLSQKRHTGKENAQGFTLDVHDPDKLKFYFLAITIG